MGKRWFQWLVAMHQKTALQPEDTLKMRGLLAGDLVEGSMINLRLIRSMPARERERECEREEGSYKSFQLLTWCKLMIFVGMMSTPNECQLSTPVWLIRPYPPPQMLIKDDKSGSPSVEFTDSQEVCMTPQVGWIMQVDFSCSTVPFTLRRLNLHLPNSSKLTHI